MIIQQWSECPSEFTPAGTRIFVRSTYSFSGDMIVPAMSEYGAAVVYMRPVEPAPTPRRYSVVIQEGDEIRLEIVSMHLLSHFDSDDPYQPHKKYLDGEVRIGISRVYNGTLDEALKWTGITQHLESHV